MTEQQYDELLAADVYMAYQNAMSAAEATGSAAALRDRIQKLLAKPAPNAHWLRSVLPRDASA